MLKRRGNVGRRNSKDRSFIAGYIDDLFVFGMLTESEAESAFNKFLQADVRTMPRSEYGTFRIIK